MDHLALTCRPKVSIIYSSHFLVANLHGPSSWWLTGPQLCGSQVGVDLGEQGEAAARFHPVLHRPVPRCAAPARLQAAETGGEEGCARKQSSLGAGGILLVLGDRGC